MTGSSLWFTVPAASGAEMNFGSISLSIAANGGFDDFSLLACLARAECSIGNAFTASFRIPASSLAGLNIAATGLYQPHPLGDDGITDLHGSINTYSSTGICNVVPESSHSLLATFLLPGLAGRFVVSERVRA